MASRYQIRFGAADLFRLTLGFQGRLQRPRLLSPHKCVPCGEAALPLAHFDGALRRILVTLLDLLDMTAQCGNHILKHPRHNAAHQREIGREQIVGILCSCLLFGDVEE